MHKTHVFLEDWQYEALQTLATREQRTISALIRELLTWHLAENQEIARQRLAAIEGIGTDGTRLCRYQRLVLRMPTARPCVGRDLLRAWPQGMLDGDLLDTTKSRKACTRYGMF